MLDVIEHRRNNVALMIFLLLLDRKITLNTSTVFIFAYIKNALETLIFSKYNTTDVTSHLRRTCRSVE